MCRLDAALKSSTHGLFAWWSAASVAAGQRLGAMRAEAGLSLKIGGNPGESLARDGLIHAPAALGRQPCDNRALIGLAA